MRGKCEIDHSWRGIVTAQADWILFVDSDDWLEDRAVEALYSRAANGDYDIVCALYCENNLNGERKFKRTEGEYFTVQDHNFFIEHQLRIEWGGDIVFAASWGKLYRKRLIEQNSIYFAKKLKRGRI